MGNYVSSTATISSETTVNNSNIVTTNNETISDKEQPKEVISKYNWKRDLPDFRDKTMIFDETKELSECIDMRDKCPLVYNQSDLRNSSIFCAIACIYQSKRPFMNYMNRKMDSCDDSENGIKIRDSIKTIGKIGTTMVMYPFDINHFNINTTSSTDTQNKVISPDKSIKYYHIRQTSTQIKAALAAGYFIIVGISVYDSFETEEVKKSGIVPIPKENESLLGGHVILLVGYNDTKKQWLFRNSFGKEWGNNGYGYLPYRYLAPKMNLSGDFWILEIIN